MKYLFYCFDIFYQTIHWFTAKPEFTQRMPNQFVAGITSRLLLKCSASGKPKPYITWTKNQGELRDGEVWTGY